MPPFGVKVDQRQADHVGRDVVAAEVFGQPAALVGRQSALAVVAGVGSQDVLVGRNQEASGAAGRVEDRFVFLWIDDADDEVNDVSRGAKLPGIALGAEN